MLAYFLAVKEHLGVMGNTVKGKQNPVSLPTLLSEYVSSVLRNRLILLLIKIVKGGLAHGVRYPYLIKI